MWRQPVSGMTLQVVVAGKYDANQQLILARYVVAPSQRTLLTMHAEVSTGYALPLAVSMPSSTLYCAGSWSLPLDADMTRPGRLNPVLRVLSLHCTKQLGISAAYALSSTCPFLRAQCQQQISCNCVQSLLGNAIPSLMLTL